MFFCVPFRAKYGDMKKKMERHPGEQNTIRDFEKPPTSWAAPVRPKLKHALRCGHIKSRRFLPKKHIKTPCPLCVTLLLRDYRSERITVRAQQIASCCRRTAELSSFEGSARITPLLPFVFFVLNLERIVGRCSLSPDHSPLTPLCNSQNIPRVIIIPTKKNKINRSLLSI